MTARNLTLFDLDGTLIAGDSDHSFGEFMVDIGWADGDAWRRQRRVLRHLRGRRARRRTPTSTSPPPSGARRTAQERPPAHARFMREVIGPMLTPQALALVELHQDAATSSPSSPPPTNSSPADRPGVRRARAARDRARARRRGAVTGAIEGVPTYQHGKVTRVGAMARGAAAPAGTISIASAFTVTPSTTCPSWSGPPTPSRPIRRPRWKRWPRERGWRILRLFE